MRCGGGDQLSEHGACHSYRGEYVAEHNPSPKFLIERRLKAVYYYCIQLELSNGRLSCFLPTSLVLLVHTSSFT